MNTEYPVRIEVLKNGEAIHYDDCDSLETGESWAKFYLAANRSDFVILRNGDEPIKVFIWTRAGMVGW